jgi:hypothetical protein
VFQKTLGFAVAIDMLTVGLITLTGCGSAGPELVPVSGSLTQNGKPVAEAKIVLHPLEPQPTQLPTPMAITDESGNFSMTSLASNDGALPGKYKVTVELRAPRRSGEETIRDGQHLLPQRYSVPATSDLIREVTAGENQWAPIDVPQR